MGLIYTEAFLKKYEEARNYGKILLKEARNEEDRQVALHQSGMVERMAGNYATAMEQFREEESVIQAFFPNDPLRMAVNLYERGYVAMKMNCFEKAEKMMQRSLDCAEKAQDDMCVGCAYRGMGEIMKGMGISQAARDYFGKAIASFTKAGDFLAVEEVKKMEETIE